jgi:hypothetical protein
MAVGWCAVVATGCIALAARSAAAVDDCVPMGDDPQDCHYEGAFACTAGWPADAVLGQGKSNQPLLHARCSAHTSSLHTRVPASFHSLRSAFLLHALPLMSTESLAHLVQHHICLQQLTCRSCAGRAGYCHKPNASERALMSVAAHNVDSLRGNLDRIVLSLDGSLEVRGWAVDPQAPGGGRTPVVVAVEVDGKEMFTGVADVSRPGG